MKHRYLALLLCLLTGVINQVSFAASTNSPAATSELIKLVDVRANSLLLFEISTNVIQIEAASDGTIRGSWHANDKRKYAGGNAQFEVKTEPTGFKLRTSKGDLLWKVKFYDNKIKISDNEAGQHAYILVHKRDSVSIQQDEKTLGTMAFKDSDHHVEVQTVNHQNRFTGSIPHFSFGPAILLLEKIPQPQRYIVAAELFARSQ